MYVLINLLSDSEAFQIPFSSSCNEGFSFQQRQIKNAMCFVNCWTERKKDRFGNCWTVPTSNFLHRIMINGAYLQHTKSNLTYLSVFGQGQCRPKKRVSREDSDLNCVLGVHRLQQKTQKLPLVRARRHRAPAQCAAQFLNFLSKLDIRSNCSGRRPLRSSAIDTMNWFVSLFEL